MNITSTNLNLYKAFIKVYEIGNLTKAATELGMAQPSLTYSIKELEKQLGLVLFKTHARGVEPTQDADKLYKAVTVAFGTIADAEDSVKDFNQSSARTIKIACTTNFATYFLAKHIVSFCKRFKNVCFEILTRPNLESTKLLNNHEVDFVLNNLPLDNKENVNTINLEILERVFYTSKSLAEKHSLKTQITKEEFEKLPFIAIQKYDKTFECFSNKVAIVDNLESSFQLVKQGLGVGWTIKQFLENIHPDANVVIFSVIGFDLGPLGINITFNPNFLSKASTEFIQEVKSALAK